MRIHSFHVEATVRAMREHACISESARPRSPRQRHLPSFRHRLGGSLRVALGVGGQELSIFTPVSQLTGLATCLEVWASS